VRPSQFPARCVDWNMMNSASTAVVQGTERPHSLSLALAALAEVAWTLLVSRPQRATLRWFD
jgi:hypothetical protein